MSKFYNEQMWEQQFEIDGEVKTYYPRSEEVMKKNLEIANDKGYKKILSRKLYPFNTMKNQHNFALIANICFNRMYDMNAGDIEYNEEEYKKLEAMKEKADRFFCLDLPVAWLPWNEWEDATALSEMAIVHRQYTCIENDRPDLVKYC